MNDLRIEMEQAEDAGALYYVCGKAITEIERLRAEADERARLLSRYFEALDTIIATESVDNDGNPAPETMACFIARKALRGIAA